MCIIQDSPSDWETESVLMAGVYGGSFLNIGANAASGPSSGLFQARNPLAGTPLSVNLTWRPGNLDQIPVTFFPEELGRGQLDFSPLSTRAWVVQERILAPRTVHFLSQRVMWECRTEVLCEADPAGRLLGNDHPRRRRSTVPALATLSPPPLTTVPAGESVSPSRRNEECLRKWNSAVELYTRANLTYQTDKLIAIAGIAKNLESMWEENTGIHYLAGLWSYNLEQSLLWCVFSAGSGRADPDAPSWSWASVQGHIHTPTFSNSRPLSLMAKVLNATATPVANIFGRVQNGSGCIVIQGPMCKVTLAQQPIGGQRRRQQLIIEGQESSAEVPQIWLQNREVEFTELKFDILPLPSHAQGREDVFLLGIGIEERIAGQLMPGLLLQRSTTSASGSGSGQQGRYVRVGKWQITDQTDPVFNSMPGRGDNFRGTNFYSLILEEFHAMGLSPGEFEGEDGEFHEYRVYIL